MIKLWFTFITFCKVYICHKMNTFISWNMWVMNFIEASWRETTIFESVYIHVFICFLDIFVESGKPCHKSQEQWCCAFLIARTVLDGSLPQKVALRSLLKPHLQQINWVCKVCWRTQKCRSSLTSRLNSEKMKLYFRSEGTSFNWVAISLSACQKFTKFLGKYAVADHPQWT